MQTPIRQKQPNFRIPYFRPSKCRLLHSAARGACPSSPPPAATVSTPKIVTDTALQSGQGFLAHPAEHNIGPLYPTQICVQLPMSAVNVTLLAFAAERRAAARAAVPLLLGARRLPRPAPPLSIDISRRHGAQQQTRRTPRLPSHDDIQTNGRTVVS